MQRFHQVLFIASLLALSWFALQAVHEFRHIFGVLLTGGAVERVVLHPMSISRTDVAPNPQPGVVVWLGPVIGCALPWAASIVVPRRHAIAKHVARFFSGFCLIANGGYLAFGAFDAVGDCGEMLRTGTPLLVIVVIGAAALSLGFYQWHRLGPPEAFLRNPTLVTPAMTSSTVGLLAAYVILSMYLSDAP